MQKELLHYFDSVGTIGYSILSKCLTELFNSVQGLRRILSDRQEEKGISNAQAWVEVTNLPLIIVSTRSVSTSKISKEEGPLCHTLPEFLSQRESVSVSLKLFVEVCNTKNTVPTITKYFQSRKAIFHPELLTE